MVRLVKYVFAGGTAALVDIGLFLLFLNCGASVQMGGTISFIIATFVNFVLSRHFVFADRRSSGMGKVAVVYAVSLVGLLLNQWILWVGTDWLHWQPLGAKLLATGLVFFWNYLIRNYYVFRH